MKVLLFLLCLYPIHAFSEDLDFSFVEELMSESDYFRSLTVLREIEFKNRGHLKGFNAQKKILSLHFRSNDYEGIDLNLEKLFNSYGRYLQIDRAETFAETKFFLQNYDTAFVEIEKTNSTLEKKYLFRAYSNEFRELPKCESEICVEIQKLEKEIKYNAPKKPELALVMGIVPGLGQIYAGNLGSGIASFFLTSFFAATSVIAYNNDEDAFGFASLTVGSIFYLSSIYAGYETAKLHNEAFVMRKRKKLRELPVTFELLNLSFD